MKINPIISLAIVFILGVNTISCENIIPEAPADEDVLDGAIEGLSTAGQARFLSGDEAFGEIFFSGNGLGPLFVANSCGSCHVGDGKGHPFTTLTRFGQTRANVSPNLEIGGPQLQNRAIPGYTPETIPKGVPFMKFTPPAVTGLGLLAALTDRQILDNADPNDINDDGISGVANYITPPDYFIPRWYHQCVNGKYIGRFGKKAATIDLLQQTVGAYNQDMGITTTFEPVDQASRLTIDPEVTDQTVRDVIFYLRTLKARIQRSTDNARVLTGKQIFSDINCSSCHRPEWTTPLSDIPALSNKTFYPYTDLLLHDMGSGLDDGATEGSAETYEWKTPALWGLGLSPDAQGGEFYLMHDGRARSIEEAILIHGGEAQDSREAFQNLDVYEKEAILKFLESL
ncbi:di-heme oxidoredictase family protein [Membranihabitans maritimus]|uniref:di-heme oxidoredictase family protein n=1 Tax=Membranihabitans maritimus TaxID=2904244 RepID=UPI001F18B6CB|nr:di-heme oxidoredictase family protein [Membranihabitans maritimus]